MEASTLFVVGIPQKDKDTRAVLSTMYKSSSGWKQRSVEKGYDNDYVNNETLKILKEWFACDFSTFKTFKKIEDAQSYYQTLQMCTEDFF